eukprot:2241465-Karenia_brevis.AAC.1
MGSGSVWCHFSLKRFERSRWIHVVSFSAAISACETDGLRQREVAMLSEITQADLEDRGDQLPRGHLSLLEG